jgi:hypothetical protein
MRYPWVPEDHVYHGVFMAQPMRSQAHARVAILTRHRKPDDPELVAARIILEELNLKELIKKAAQTRARIAALRMAGDRDDG